MKTLTPISQEHLDLTIGRLDHLLSEFLGLYRDDLDEANRQTLKHHADDLIGVGKKMQEELSKPLSQPQQSREEFLKENPPWS